MDSSSQIICSSVISLLAIYDLTSPYFPTSKQRAWILTVLSSGILTCTSLVYLYDFAVVGGGSVLAVHSHGPLDCYILRFFQSYLISDLILGAFSYPEQVNLLSGWIHHPVYVIIAEVALHKDWTHIFCLASIMELPTFLLGTGKLFPSLRTTVGFTICFALTRILFHASLVFLYSLPRTRVTLSNPSLTPAIVLAAMLCLHVVWFYQCLAGFWRRSKAPTLSPISSPTKKSALTRTDPTLIVIPRAMHIPELQQPRQPTYHLLTRSNLWRRRRVHRRMMYERVKMNIPHDVGHLGAKIYEFIPERQTLYDAVGLGKRIEGTRAANMY